MISILGPCWRSRGRAVRVSCRVRTQNVMPDTIGKMVARVLAEQAAALELGALVTIDQQAARVRVLPIL